MKTAYRHRIYLLIVLITAFFTRFNVLGRQNIAFDEGFSLAVAQAPWAVAFNAILSDGVHPPLFYALLKLMTGLYGFTEFGARFIIAVFSVAGVAILYRLGKNACGPTAGLFAAALLAVNPLHIWLAQEARMYSLLSLLITANMGFFWRGLNYKNRANWIGLAATAGAIYLTHYFGLLVPVIQLVFIGLAFKRYHHRLLPWLAAQTVAGIMLLPWLVLTARRDVPSFGLGFLVTPEPADIPLTLWNMVCGIVPQPGMATVAVWLIGGVGLALALKHTLKDRFTQLLLVWIFLPVLLVWAMSQQRSFYADRYLSFIIPPLLLMIGWGLSRLPSAPAHGLTLALVCLLWANHAGQFDSLPYQKDAWREAAGYIAQNAQADDIILLRSAHIQLPFDYYYHGPGEQKLSSFNTTAYPIATLTSPARRTWVVMPYTRRPTHYPMQPETAANVWELDEAAGNLQAFVTQNQARLLDQRRFLGVEIWLVDTLRAP